MKIFVDLTCKPCKGFVAVLCVPISTYMQEIGRAGRDGLLETATIFYTNRDTAENVKHHREEMRDICLIKSCRRAKLLSYFGDKTVLLTSHTCCDNCRLTCKCESCLQVTL